MWTRFNCSYISCSGKLGRECRTRSKFFRHSAALRKVSLNSSHDADLLALSDNSSSWPAELPETNTQCIEGSWSLVVKLVRTPSWARVWSVQCPLGCCRFTWWYSRTPCFVTQNSNPCSSGPGGSSRMELAFSSMTSNRHATVQRPSYRLPNFSAAPPGSGGPHHQDSGEARIRESTAGVSRKPSSDGKAGGSSSKHLCGLTAWNT